ncbi:alpha-L-rhamnosidase-like protein [Chitinophaga polysaccharea]|uniref:Alpha-L-rhamnosidase-like protein n=1 Tax=Chitinophaga polysaccharea TaxID=1293035 RepID=A0A561PXA8_9BACT|nr:alpha-L-rhamnosidase C-terminal domain-containing protein [Chitinophaga polysaccharea]TWF42718.1 alpha-L-rhamnosidase-like protein [Chitinophaga polysaccharea]
MKISTWLASFSALLLWVNTLRAQLPPVFDSSRMATVQTTATVRRYLSPEKITWQTPNADGASISNAARFLLPGNGQADLANQNMCVLKSSVTAHPAILFDFGKELHGGLQLVTGMYKSGKPIKLRVRFGESVSEAMSDIEPSKNATNDHAVRDMVVEVPWLGKLEVGNTGFRFVRIDLLDDKAELQLKEVRAIFVYRDLPYLGSFKCSDELLNKIWLTGAYTVHLNMQDYLWDGIKRDRLVWIGDMHPETSTISAVFGYNEVVPRSLDLARDITPIPQYMNGMVSYSMWWVLIQRDWYQHTGNSAYLQQQASYLKGLLGHLCKKIDTNNSEDLNDGTRFLDWPSSENKPGIHAGLQAMMIMTLKAGADLSKVLKDEATARQCEAAIARLKRNVPDANGSKQAAALLALADLVPAEKINREMLSAGGVKDYSTFYGYYMLQAKAKAGDYQGGLNDIRTYWGAMLKLGATTFWEDFNMDWLPGAARIDTLVQPGQKDIHGDYGAYCYKGLRHSLCHGWASGPTPWLTEHVLGISVVAPGCRVIRVAPHLGDLRFAEGTFPTPYGVVKVKHTRLANGKIQSTIKAPAQVKIIRE